MESVETIEDSKTTDVFKWDDSSTRLLLNFYKDGVKDFGKVSHLKTKHQLWVHVIEELSKYGYNVNPKQAQNRLVTLERSYKKRKSDLKGRHHSNCVSSLFDDEVGEIMEKKKSTVFGNDLNELLSESNNCFEDHEYFSFDHLGFNETSITMSSEPVSDLNRWDPKSTKLFINVYLNIVKNPSKMRSFKRKSKLWQYIADQVNSQGYEYTGKQTRNRFGTLIRSYKKFLEKKRCGVRGFFMFEPEVREMLKHKIIMPDPGEGDSDGYNDDDDVDLGDTNEVDVKYISIDEASIDNIAIISESETLRPEFPQSSNIPHSATSPYTNENFAILNELKLLRKTESQFHQQMAKIEEEKLDLMRQNNILLKVLIEKLTKKS